MNHGEGSDRFEGADLDLRFPSYGEGELVELLPEHVGVRHIDGRSGRLPVCLADQRALRVHEVGLVPVVEVEVVEEIGLGPCSRSWYTPGEAQPVPRYPSGPDSNSRIDMMASGTSDLVYSFRAWLDTVATGPRRYWRLSAW